MVSLKKKRFSIKIEGEMWDTIKPTEKFDKDRIELRLNDPWTDVISDLIWDTQTLSCCFNFKRQKFFKSENFPYFKITGYCAEKKCGQQLIGECKRPDVNGVEIDFECFDTTIDIVGHTKVRNLAGRKRQLVKKDLLVTKPTKYKAKLAKVLLNDSGGSCPLLYNTQVLSTARQEARDEDLNINKYPGDPITSIMLMMDDYPCIRQLSTEPFYVWYWSTNQIVLWQEAFKKGATISIDASGSFVKTVDILDNNKTGHIFIYNVVTHIDKKIYTLCQALSCIHDTNSIFSWLLFWIKSGAPVPVQVVVDCSSALLNAVSLAFNKTTFKTYLNICFNVLNGDKSKVLPPCLIKRDRAHLIKAASNWKCFQGDHWVKKDFLLRCIGFSLEISNFEILISVVESIFIVCESKYSDPETECFKRKAYLMKLIETFDLEEKYNKDEEGHDELQRNYDYLADDFDSCTDDISKYIYDIYNQCLKRCSNESQFQVLNNYYLPSATTNLLALYSQFVAWTNVLNEYYPLSTNVATSTASECYFKIMRKDYNMSCPVTVNRFLMDHLDVIDGATKMGRSALKSKKVLETKNMDSCSNIEEQKCDFKTSNIVKKKVQDKSTLKNITNYSHNINISDVKSKKVLETKNVDFCSDTKKQKCEIKVCNIVEKKVHDESALKNISNYSHNINSSDVLNLVNVPKYFYNYSQHLNINLPNLKFLISELWR